MDGNVDGREVYLIGNQLYYLTDNVTFAVAGMDVEGNPIYETYGSEGAFTTETALLGDGESQVITMDTDNGGGKRVCVFRLKKNSKKITLLIRVFGCSC